MTFRGWWEVWTPILVVMVVVVGSVVMGIAKSQHSEAPLTEEDCADGCLFTFSFQDDVPTQLSTEGCPVEIPPGILVSSRRMAYIVSEMTRCAYAESHNRHWTDPDPTTREGER